MAFFSDSELYFIYYLFHGCFFCSASKADVRTNVPLYIGMVVAFSMFSVVIALVIRLLKRKDRDHSMYNMASSGKCVQYFFVHKLFRL